MTSKTRLRFAVPLSVLTGIAAVAACDYGSDPEGAEGAPEAFQPAAGDGDVVSEGNGAGDGASEGSGAGDTASQGSGTGDATSQGTEEGAPNPAGIDMGGGEGGGINAGGAEDLGAGGASMPEDGMDSGEEPVGRPEGSCDIYGAGNTPCVAAYSTVRALSSGYDGPLYQVRRGAPNPFQNTGNGGQLQDIGLLSNGFADGAAQNAFCGDQPCTVSVLYDQSGQGNDLRVAPAGGYGCNFNPPDTACEDDYESATVALSVGGNAVNGLAMAEHEGYRNNQAVNVPEGADGRSMYMVTAGTGTRPQVAPACCWDFGLASRDNNNGPTGIMAALMFGTGFWGRGAGNGPWFMADLEAGVFAGGTAGGITGNGTIPFDTIAESPSMTMDYAFGILETDAQNYALRMGNAQQGGLTTAYDGPLPTKLFSDGGWRVQGGIILGIGGDNSNHGSGTFFEGVITAGRPSGDTGAAVLRNVQAVGYGR